MANTISRAWPLPAPTPSPHPKPPTPGTFWVVFSTKPLGYPGAGQGVQGLCLHWEPKLCPGSPPSSSGTLGSASGAGLRPIPWLLALPSCFHELHHAGWWPQASQPLPSAGQGGWSPAGHHHCQDISIPEDTKCSLGGEQTRSGFLGGLWGLCLCWDRTPPGSRVALLRLTSGQGGLCGAAARQDLSPWG